MWALFCELGFWGWISAFCGFLFFSFPSGGVFAARRAFPWAMAFLFCYVAWIAGMLNA